MKWLLLILILATACVPVETPQDVPDQDLPMEEVPDEPVACTADAKECPDGTFVGRVAPDCEFEACPEFDGPEGATLCPEERREACTREYIPVCGSDDETYGNGCTACAEERVAWFVSGACEEPSEFTLCEGPRPEICTMEYNPVCGLREVQCITEPCDSIEETFSNGCGACSNKNVIGYTLGEC